MEVGEKCGVIKRRAPRLEQEREEILLCVGGNQRDAGKRRRGVWLERGPAACEGNARRGVGGVEAAALLAAAARASAVTAQVLKTITWASAGWATTLWPATRRRAASVSISL